ncbi:MAG: hypothetical protein IKZ43_09210 [Acidaminococcaceae bacterium]|nr:hypothetical protein [Acidaminococcaceae bacterium]
MKKTAMATVALLLMGAAFSAAALAAPVGTTPGVRMTESHRVHVNPGARLQTPVHNRVHMTPIHSVSGPAGGRMSSYRPAPVSGRVIVRPSLPLPRPVGAGPVTTVATTGGLTVTAPSWSAIRLVIMVIL